MTADQQDTNPSSQTGLPGPSDTVQPPAESARIDFDRGLAVLKAEIAHLPGRPGVYRMFNETDEPLYVGKARHLARRVASYTRVGWV